MARNETLPEFATDFLGNEICVGDTVVYPTGGTSCRMVRAIVREVRDFREHCYQVDSNNYQSGARVVHKVWRSRAGRNGSMGPIAFKIQVTREQEGSRSVADPDAGVWGIDGEKKVTLDQLHRVVSVTALERKARSAHIIETGAWGEHMRHVIAGELPPIKNVPLWGDGDTSGPGWPD